MHFHIVTGMSAGLGSGSGAERSSSINASTSSSAAARFSLGSLSIAAINSATLLVGVAAAGSSSSGALAEGGCGGCGGGGGEVADEVEMLFRRILRALRPFGVGSFPCLGVAAETASPFFSLSDDGVFID